MYFSDTSTAGSATINNYASTYFSGSSTGGNATIVNNLGGTIDFSGTSGPNGDHKISAGSIAGEGNYILGANELTVGSNNSSTEVAGIISGVGGSLVKTGTGTLILSGANTYTGATRIAGGILQIGNGGSTGSIAGDVINDSVLAFNRTGTLTLSGNISGSGEVRQIGPGSTTLTGTNSYTGDTIISNGRLQFGDGSVGGVNTLAGNVIVNGGTLAISTPSTLNVAQNVTLADNTALSIVAGVNSPALSADRVSIGTGVSFNLSGISDASQLDKVLINTNSGIAGDFANITIGGFSGAVDYLTVSTHKSADNLQYLASYGLSWFAGNNLAHGTFTLTNPSDTFTVGAALTDQAANPATGWSGTNLVKEGAGTLILTGTNTYTGGTTVNNGTLQLGNLANTGTITRAVAVETNGTLSVVNADTSGVTSLFNRGSAIFYNSTSASNALIENRGLLAFHDTSTAGAANITNLVTLVFVDASTAGSALIENSASTSFDDTSTAGTATITNYATLNFAGASRAGSARLTNSAQLNFNNTSTADAATITNNNDLSFNNASTAGAAQISNVGSGTLTFNDTSTAGTATITNTSNVYFYNTSSADAATIINNTNGRVDFRDSSTAGTAQITNDFGLYFRGTSTAGSATITTNEYTEFFDNSTAGTATITNNRFLYFSDNSTAGNAAIINNDTVGFGQKTTGGNARLINSSSSAVFNFSNSAGPNSDSKLSAGSIEGGGQFFLGATELTVGANNRSTEVSGVISGVGGSLVKTGTGTMILTGTNTYTGGTTIDNGTLQLGTISTAGKIVGAVTVGVGTQRTLDIVNADTSGITNISNNGFLFFRTGTSASSATITSGGSIYFYGNSTADTSTINHNGGLYFNDTSTAGAATITNGGIMSFVDSATAGSAYLNNNFALSFFNTSTGGNAHITNKNRMYLYQNSTLGNAIVVNDVGTASIEFNNSSSAGAANITNYTNITFKDSSTAGFANIINYYGVNFVDNSTAGMATLDNKSGGTIGFWGNSSANNATITNAGTLAFNDGSKAGNATIGNDGTISFYGTSTADTARITNSTDSTNPPAFLYFEDSSTAGTATITNHSVGTIEFRGTSTAAGAEISNNNKLYFKDGSTAGGARITNNVELYFNNTASAGSATIYNNNSLQFFDSSTAGTATIYNNQQIYFSNTSSAGSAIIRNGGTLAFNQNATGGNAQLINSGLAARMDFSGSTGPNNDHKLSAGSIAGNGQFILGDNELTVGGNNRATEVSGVISGVGGSLVKVGGGRLTLSGDNTYTGGTTINDGMLQIGNGGTSGSVLGNIVNNASLTFNRSDAYTFAGDISGSGALYQTGTGATILTGTNSYSGDTFIYGGRLQFGDGSVGGSNVIGGNLIVDTGMLAIYTPATLKVAQNVTFADGTALSIVAGANSPALSADHVAIGDGVSFNLSGISNASQLDKVLINTNTGISGDFASVSVGGFTGSVDYLTVSTRKSADNLQYLASYGLSWFAGNNLAHGTFTLTNATDTFTVGTALTDQAANPATGWGGRNLIKAGAGTLILTARNTYSGGTSVNDGTLQIGDAGNQGSVVGRIDTYPSGILEVFNADMSGVTDILNVGTTNFRNDSSASGANITNSNRLSFYGTSSAGSATIGNSGNVSFFDDSTAGFATINNSSNGNLSFNNASKAGAATINNDGSLSFNGASTADTASITNPGRIFFYDASTAGSATITNDGHLNFRNDSAAGPANITNNNIMSFADNSATNGATITNSGRLSFADNSVASGATITNTFSVYFGDSSSASDARIINNEYVDFSGTATAGTADITNNLNLVFLGTSSAGNARISNGSSVTFMGQSTGGNAQLINTGASASIDFSNSTGPSNDNKLSAGSIDGDGRFILGANELTVGSTNLSTEVSGVISGAGGSLVKVGTGTLTLSEINTYTGGTTVNGGTLQLGSGARVGGILGNVTVGSNGTFDIVNADLSGITGILNGGATNFRNNNSAGGIGVTNNGTLSFLDTSTAGTAAITNNSNLLFKDTSTAAHASITNSSSAATLTFSNASTAGNADISNTGIVLFNDTTTAGNATITNDATVNFYGNSTGGNAVFVNNAGGTVNFATTVGAAGDGKISAGSIAGAGNYDLGANELTVGSNNSSTEVSGVISGAGGSLVKTGTGTMILSGNNSYSGNTTINDGTLQIGNGGGTGSIAGDVINNSVLAFNRTGTLTLAGSISGTGQVQQTGAGTTVLTGSNSYSGDTIISNGRLQFGDGSAGGSNNLAGNVKVNGGMLAIESPATLNVGQDVTFADNTGLSISAGINSPALSADRVLVGNNVGFNISGISDASQLDKVLIDTRSGITGDFAPVTIGGFNGTVDYLTVSTRKSADNLQYLASYNLSWFAGNSLAHGTYTLTNPTDTFTIGVALTDQAANPATGWNGTSLTKAGAGTLILTGANTYTGGTAINAGTLQIGNAGLRGSVVGAVTVGVGGTFEVFNADMSGVTNIANNGATNFRNATSASSAHIANAGALSFFDSSSAGSAAIVNTYTVDFKDASTAGDARINNRGPMVFSNTSTAGNAIIQNGDPNTFIPVPLAFLDSSSAANATITNDSTLQFFDNATAGTANITNNKYFTFDGSSSAGHATIANTAGGRIDFSGSSTAGSAIISSDGVISFAQTASAGSATITNQGSLSFIDSSTAGNATIANNGGGSLRIANTATAGSATITNSGNFVFVDQATAGNAIITNAHKLEFHGSSTAGGATITNNGFMWMTSQAAAGSATIINTSQLQFDTDATGGSAIIINSGNVLFDGNSTPDKAQLINNGASAVFDLSMTTGPNSDNKLTAGSIAGNGTFYLGGKELTVGANNLSTEVSGVIADGGTGGYTGASLIKVGTGKLTLSGINTYTGETKVDDGTLSVNGSIASSSRLTVNSGATLAGNGTVGNTVINAGGTLSPGNSIGLLTVQGDLTFMAGSTYRVEVSPSNADRVNVSGTATLNGASLAAMYDPGSYVNKRYTVLNAAGGVNGTFSGPVNTNLPTNFSSALSYDTNNAYLDLTLSYTPPTAPSFGGGLTVNQARVAQGLVNSFNFAGGIPLVFGALGPGGLTQASGESATGVQQSTFAIMDRFLNLMTDPYASGRATAMLPMSYTGLPRGAQPIMVAMQPRWSIWAAGYGGTQTTRGNAFVGSNTYTGGIYGMAAGADYHVSPDTVVGFALGGGGTSYHLANGLGSGSSNVFQAGLYGRQTFGALYAAGSLAYGWQDVTTDRRVMFDQLRARFSAHSFSGRLETGYRIASPFGGLTPYAAGQFTNIALPNYSEQAITGPGLFALNYASKNVTAWRTELGVRGDTAIDVGAATLWLRGRLAWAHNFNPNRSLSAAFLNLPASSFVVNGAAQARNAALVSAGAEMKWPSGWSIMATFEGEFSGRGNSYAGKGGVRYQW
ncbi:autotransporter-associated beta strand repeat-containing protein [Methylocella sp. CPCC 101449]|nr:autotransporter-associated beta strand repeat-containing protein [Methylocella sp. CPCC 101449]